MTGHIRRRGKNSFELKWEAGADPVTRKRRIRYQSFKGSKRDAQIELARLVTANAKGEAVDPSKATIGEFLDRWERNWAVANTSPKTFERYSELLRLHVRPHIGHVLIQKLRPVHLNELYGKLLREGRGKLGGLAPRTVGHVHRLLHRLLGHAAKWDVVLQNVASHVSPPRVASTEVVTLPAAEVRAILLQLEGKAVHVIASVALATGMRRGELCAVRWKDVDLDKGLVRIERSLEQTKKGGLRFKSPKTKHGRRTITIPASTVAELRDHWRTQQEQRLKLGMGKAPADALIFATWDAEIRSPSGLTKEWKRNMVDIGTPTVTLQSLRHTHASHLIAAGLDILTISRRMGHSSPTVTLNVYGHLFASTADRAAQIMEATFSAGREK